MEIVTPLLIYIVTLLAMCSMTYFGLMYIIPIFIKKTFNIEE